MLIHTDPATVNLTIDGDRLTTTPEHPFYTQDRGWVDAADLRLGEHVRKADGSYGTVKSIILVKHPQKMYNLTVEKDHTFFVGEGHWLVHNCAQPFDILEKYKPGSTPGYEQHHGVMDVWARENLGDIGYAKNDSPVMVLTKEQHAFTKTWFSDWRLEETGSRFGQVDWKSMSPRQAQQMSYDMFKAAGVPSEAIENYFSAFNRYVYNLQ